MKPIISKGWSRGSFCFFFSLERFPKSILVVWPREWYQINPQNIWNKRIEPIFDWRSQNFFETFKVALQCRFLMFGCQNESKMASEISKIHFWGQKIKFSFWLNKCFWNVLQLVKHIQESYFYIFKVVTHSESYLCRQHKAKNGWKPTSEISKIHFWGQKIKFSFWLNKKRSNAKKQKKGKGKQKKGKGNSDRSRMNLRNSRWEFHHDESKIIFIYLIQTITKILQFWLKT